MTKGLPRRAVLLSFIFQFTSGKEEIAFRLFLREAEVCHLTG